MASKHVQGLENQLGVRLFNRTTRKLNLTEIGMIYVDKVNAVLSEIDEAESVISELNSEPSER